MSIPANITKTHLLQAIKKIDREGIPTDGQSRYYDAFYANNGKPYPPKLILSYANLYANGSILDRNTFSGGLESECFRILKSNGFLIHPKSNTMNTYRVKIYDIKKTAISVENAQRTFSQDGRYFFWNDSEFKYNQLGDYIFFVNKSARQAFCTQIGYQGIRGQWNRRQKETVFTFDKQEYSVSDPEKKYASFNRFSIYPLTFA